MVLGTEVSSDRLRNNAASMSSSRSAINDINDDVVKQQPHAGMTAATKALAVQLEQGLVLLRRHDNDAEADDDDSLHNNHHHRDDDDDFAWKHRAALAQAITLVESRAAAKQVQATLLLTHLMRHHREKEHFRIGM